MFIKGPLWLSTVNANISHSKKEANRKSKFNAMRQAYVNYILTWKPEKWIHSAQVVQKWLQRRWHLTCDWLIVYQAKELWWRWRGFHFPRIPGRQNSISKTWWGNSTRHIKKASSLWM
jgi:hypothetical protein